MAKSKETTGQTVNVNNHEQARGKVADAEQKTAVLDNTMETTEAKRVHVNGTPAEKKEEMAKLLAAIAKLRCKHCNSLGTFTVFSTVDRTRYLKCMACGRTGHKIIV